MYKPFFIYSRNEEGFDWQKTITKLREYNNDILVALWVGPDGKDSDDYIVQVRIQSYACKLKFLLAFFIASNFLKVY
jgi:hypothetical protein